MNNQNYALGLDFGTLSVRALLVNLENGEESAVSVKEYPHGVMDEFLPSGKKLPNDFALQHPLDYVETMSEAIREILKTGISAEEIAQLAPFFR